MTVRTTRAGWGWLNDWRVLGGLAGIIFFVLFVIGGPILSGDSPTISDDIDEIRSYWQDDGDRYLVGDWLVGIAFLFFFWPFAAAMRSILGAVDPSGGVWSRVAFVGAIAFPILGAVAAVAGGTLAMTEAEDLDDSTLRFATYASAYGFTQIGLGGALMTTAASIVILQTRVFWWWLGLLGLASALLSMVGALWVIEGDEEGALATIGFIGIGLLGLWVLLVAINMLVDRNREARAAEAAGVRVP